MSKFFKALEQAERERALREQARRQAAGPTEVAPRAPATPRQDSPPVQREGAVAPPLGEGIRSPESQPASQVSGEAADGVEEHLVSLLVPSSFEAEQYRALRHMVEQIHKASGLSIVAVSSPTPGDGKTTTAINLAGALAQAPEARVLLADADLRRPSVGDYLGLGASGRRGLVDAILAPGLSLEDVGGRRRPFNLSVLPAGRRLAAPYELLKSARLGELLEEARRRYDYIVLDTPPLVPFPDCRVIGKWVDGFLLVVAAHKTPRKLVEEALSVMDPAKIVGLVFNGDDRQFSGYYYAYGQSPDGVRTGSWGRAGKKVGGSPRRRRSSRPGGAR
ncbi:MAG: CpsD/CapB family tyrosine-protein kinase [Acidobacteria bacterium]|nr:CpsD/CapB family tyrosine-protein kinase [Acidobacteriota bacterium]